MAQRWYASRKGVNFSFLLSAFCFCSGLAMVVRGNALGSCLISAFDFLLSAFASGLAMVVRRVNSGPQMISAFHFLLSAFALVWQWISLGMTTLNRELVMNQKADHGSL